MDKDNSKEAGKSAVLIAAVLLTSLFICKSSYANPSETANIEAEAEYKFSDFERDPAPVLASDGTNLAQDYKLRLDAGVFKDGFLDALLGISIKDKYRQDDVDLENRVNFDYARWLKINTLTKQETDEEIFFSGTTEPQSPIHTITRKYDAKLALNAVYAVEYILENKERKDLLLGTVTGEENTAETVRFVTDNGVSGFTGEYRQNSFDDLLGTRSDVDSRDLNFGLSYRPVDYFNISGVWEDSEDKDLINDTQLESKERQLEFMLKPLKELKLRNRLNLRQDTDTKTQEDINNKSDEIIVNFDPVKQASLELAYKREDEDKQRVSSDIDSTSDEERLKLRLSPYKQVTFQAGYEISDKQSSSSTENIENTKMYSDISFQPAEPLRATINVSENKQKNTFTSSTESDTKSIAANIQYRPRQNLTVFMQADTTKTDNPSTGSFTKTDTLSSNLNIKPVSFMDMALRTSRQETSGSSESSLSERLLNAIEFNFNIIENLKLSTEYEFIDSSGTTSSDENLVDIATFYNIGKFDFTLRYQERSVTGEGALDKTTALSNIKYRFSPNAALSFRFSLIDFTDNKTPSNSYDSLTMETLLSMRF